ncbi:MAG: acyl-CoA dehydrogenase family protein [Candidatus Lokiarchaeota archaeon]|nr:acyl-CoA dehydrogenase family protein [Candidatus Lokiarchaeota archaeon]
MDFEFSEKHKLVRRSVRAFAEDILGPLAPIMDRDAQFSWEAAKELSKINAWGLQLPEKYGGAELDSISYAIVIEEISKICAATGLTISVHNSVSAYPILKFGSEEQKEKYLPNLASGKKIGAFAWTEPNAGSDAGAIESLAIEEGDHFILNGSKIFVTNGGIASTFLIGAKYKTKDGKNGYVVFILDKNMKGFEVGEHEDKMGLRGSSTTSLYFHDINVPKDSILGKLNDGFKIGMHALDVGRIGIAAQALGIAQAAYEHSINYSKGRIQFNKPISQFQGVSFKLAEMSTKIDAARFLLYRTAFLKDKGVNFSKETAMSKYYASFIARDIAQEAIQIHGGYGYMKDLPIERYYRDAKVCEIYEGSNEIMKFIISREILKGNL